MATAYDFISDPLIRSLLRGPRLRPEDDLRRVDPMPLPQYQSRQRDLLDSTLGGLQYLGETLDKPGSAVRGLIHGLTQGDLGAAGGSLLNAVPFSDATDLTDPSQRISGRQQLEDWGLLAPNSPGLGGIASDQGWSLADAAGDVAGFTYEVATDPLTYATFGLGAVTKLGNAFRKSGILRHGVTPRVARLAGKTSKSGKLLGEREARMVTTVDDFWQHGGLAVREKIADIATQQRVPVEDFVKQFGGEQIGTFAKYAGKNVGKGPMAQGLARSLDALGAGINKVPVLGPATRAVRGVFDPDVRGARTAEVQESAKYLSGESSAGATNRLAEMYQKIREIEGFEGTDVLDREGFGAGSASLEESIVKSFGEEGRAYMPVMKAAARTWSQHTGLSPDEVLGRLSTRKGKLSDVLDSANETLFQGGEDVPLWYSKLRSVVEDPKFTNKVSQQQLVATLSKAGVKQEEIVEAKLEKLFGKRKSVGKQELLDHLDTHRIPLEETIKSARRLKEVLPEGWEPVQDPGGVWEIFDEAGAKVELDPSIPEHARIQEAIPLFDYKKYVSPGGENYTEQLLRVPGRNYQKGHWNEKDTVVHLRTTERKDPRFGSLKHAEEIQADIHQQGRHKGYTDIEAEKSRIAELEAARDRAKAELSAYREELHQKYTTPFQDPSLEEVKKLKDLDAEYGRLLGEHFNASVDFREMAGKVVPDTPFKTNWHELALKRLLRSAAEEGHDAISWTQGVEQVQRWGDSNLRQLYDVKLPSFAKKYAKKWGVQPQADVLEDGVIAWVLPINDAMRKDLLEKPQTLFQKGSRGAITFEGTQATITAFENADISTLAHETSHFFRRIMEDMEPDLLNRAGNALGVTDGNWTTEAEEAFATGFERYMLDGKAPTKELKSTFERFKTWLVEIYRSIVGTPAEQNINPQLKGVFDQLLSPDKRTFGEAKEEAMRAYLELGPKYRQTHPDLAELRPETKRLLRKMKSEQRAIHRQARALGIDAKQYEGEYGKHFFRGALLPQQEWDEISPRGKTIFETTSAMIRNARRAGIYDLPGQTVTVNNYIRDPRFTSKGRAIKDQGEAAAQLVREVWGHDLPDEDLLDIQARGVADPKSLAPDEAQVFKAIDQAEKFAEWLAKRSPKYLEEDARIFGKHVAEDHADYMTAMESLVRSGQEAYRMFADLATPDPGDGAGMVPLVAAFKQLNLGTNKKRTLKAAMQYMQSQLRGDLDGANLKDLWVPKRVVDDANHIFQKVGDPREISLVEKLYDSVNNLFKLGVTAFPAFHVRNQTSGMVQNWLTGAFTNNLADNVRHYHVSKKLLQGSQEIKGLAESYPIFKKLGIKTDAEATRWLRESMHVYDISRSNIADLPTVHQGDPFDPGLLGGKERLQAMQPGTRPLGIGQAFKDMNQEGGSWNPFKSAGVYDPATDALRDADQFKVARLHRSIGNYVEGINRASGWLGWLKQGVDPQEAAARIKRSHVDYSKLTDVEKRFIRRAVPFWSFTKGMAQHLAKELMERPGGRTAQTIRATTIPQRDRENYLPDYIGEGAAIPLGTTVNPLDGSKSQKVMSSLGLMHENPLALLAVGENPRQSAIRTMQKLGAQVAPHIKAPLVEATTGIDLFTGRNLYDLDPTVGRTLSNIMGEAEPRRIAGSASLGPFSVEHTIASSPLARLATTARKATDPRKTYLDRFANLMTGVRVSNVDEEKSREIAARKANEQIMAAQPNIRQFESFYLKGGRIPTQAEREALSYMKQAEKQAKAIVEKRAGGTKKRADAVSTDPQKIIQKAKRYADDLLEQMGLVY